jgi:hypothetical protein
MAKKKMDINALRSGMKKTKSVQEIEDAVSKIHEEKEPVAKVPKPKPKPKVESKTRINLNIPKSQHLKFKIWCLENETTITDEILKFIQSKI